jgi:hypothetical protein
LTLISGVSAPIVGTTSLDNLYDLIGVFVQCYFPSFLVLTVVPVSSIGAVNVQLTEEEKKALEAPYLPQAAYGHS